MVANNRILSANLDAGAIEDQVAKLLLFIFLGKVLSDEPDWLSEGR